MIDAYKGYWAGFTDFRGKTTLKGYWLALLAHVILNIILTLLIILIGTRNAPVNISLYMVPFQCSCVLPSLAITIRRLSDAGYNWTNIFWVFLPIIGSILLIIKLCKPSIETNQFDRTQHPATQKKLGVWRIPSGFFLMWGTLISIVPMMVEGYIVDMNLFWWISKITLIAFAVIIIMGKRDYTLLIPAGIYCLLELRILLVSVSFSNFLSLATWLLVFGLLVMTVMEDKSFPEIVNYIPAGLYFLYTIISFIGMRYGTEFFFITVVYLFRALALLFLGIALKEQTPMLQENLHDNTVTFHAPPPVPELKVPGVLLVRFNIDKLNDLSGSYGYQSGKLIGQAVPSKLMESMTVSDGDSAATLAGQEYVCIVSISSNDISILKEKIEPLITSNSDIQAYGAYPVTQIVSQTNEPLVMDGVVKNGKIIGNGGWCANGFMDAWKDEDIETSPSYEAIADVGKTIKSPFTYQAKPTINYASDIGSILFSIVLIMAGASGQFVLRGTNSSTALIVAGMGFLAWDIYGIVNKRGELNKYEKQYNERAQKIRNEVQNVMNDQRELKSPVNLRIHCDSYLSNLELGACLNGKAMTWNPNDFEFVSSITRIKNIITFNNLDTIIVFDIIPGSDDLVLEMSNELTDISITLPNQAILKSEDSVA